ncbi:MAG: sigma-70 family RNA polymerase sigma factor [Chloroflexi bacterium]|nr:sigma-70 family RNA polymerase sigma factor [Chloroflexota bacterium]
MTQIIASSLNTPLDQDSNLVLAAQKNPALFQTIYDRWAVRIYQYFYARTGERPSAEDLTSQLFLSAYQALPRYQDRGHFTAWLFAIARNLAAEYYRKERREVPLEAALPIPASSDPPAEAAHHDEIAHLKSLIQALPDEDQELIRLRYVAELPFAEMALLLNKREDAVKKSLYRLQARLQSLLEQTHD